MLRINRVKVEINTAIGMYGFDTKFEDGLTFLASEENTYGKSYLLLLRFRGNNRWKR